VFKATRLDRVVGRLETFGVAKVGVEGALGGVPVRAPSGFELSVIVLAACFLFHVLIALYPGPCQWLGFSKDCVGIQLKVA